MRKVTALFIICTAFIFPVYGQEAYIDYVEGEVHIRDTSGNMEEAYDDDELETGDTIISGADGFAEINFDNTIIRVSENTVFQLLDNQTAGQKASVLSCVVGSIFLKVETLSEDQLDLQINTPSANCGVRGTEFSVFSGVDGSSLIVVENGKVAVESRGKTVELSKEEGVEVNAGEAPGEKFTVLRGKVDFSQWNEKKLTGFMDDPISAVKRVQAQLDDFIDKLNEVFNVYSESHNKLRQEREKLASFPEDQDKERKAFYKETVFPLEVKTSNLYLNVRYHALSALSLRRYVMGKLYIIIKTNSIRDLDSREYRDFIDVYKSFLSRFETYIVPHLGERDI